MRVPAPASGAERPLPRAAAAGARSWRPLALAVVIVGLVLTAVLSWITYSVNSHNERRLLKLQVKQTGTVLQVALSTVQTPLVSVAEIAATSSGDIALFRSYMTAYVGAKASFVSASLWRIDGSAPRPVTVVGAAPELTSDAAAATFFASTIGKSTLSVAGPLGTGSHRRLGFGFAAAGPNPSFAVYAESALPPDRKVKIAADSAFVDLHFALYLGPKQRADKLLETNVDLPVPGPTAMVVVPFGSTSLTLVAGANGQLGGALSGAVWWLVAVAGAALSVVSGFAANRLVQRRRAAEDLTGEVQYLLREQRGIAESLQRALLPQALPEVPGVEVGVRYIPGFVGVEIGGDWYDIIRLDERRFFFVVGDVSGRGVAAGAVMAELHFAIRGFVSEGHQPAKILDTLTGLLDVTRDHHFATVLCGVADVESHEVTIANAGHLPPLLVTAAGSSFMKTTVGPPIGVKGDVPYEQVTLTVPPRATVLTYTDGLIERRGETLDDGMARLQELTVEASPSLEALLGTLVSTLGQDDSDDDTAILGMRWLI